MREVGGSTAHSRRASGAAPHESVWTALNSGREAYPHPRSLPVTGHDAPPVRRTAYWATLAVFGLMAAGLAASLDAAGEGRSLFDRDRLARLAGFGIDQVSVTGQRYTSDADLFAALDLEHAKSLASFDPGEVRRRFEQLPWIRSAEITRLWPGELRIRVSERQPFALWEHGSTANIIDQTGRVLSAVKPDAPLDLPRISGAGADREAGALFEQLGQHPDIVRRMASAERIGARRWTLHLKNGVALMLPPDAEATALARLTRRRDADMLMGTANRILDLRARDRIVLRDGHRTRNGTSGGRP
ncbi:MAG: FtsQ-type POTRA domain-containing protein [Hyphomicrobium sp.]|nr:FtsQ-type POTRA domain-containing protein [Hyphomicrobium sp.]